MAKFLSNLLYTEPGKTLELTAEQEEDCKVVYKLGGDGKTALFHSLWNPEKEYGDEYMIAPVRSVYNGISSEYPANTPFANIEGSSADPRHCSSWIGLIRTVYQNNPKADGTFYSANTCCAERDTIYVANPADIRIDGFDCCRRIVGGHVIMNARNSSAVEPNQNVMLLPICNRHNTYNSVNGRTGSGYFMKLERPMKAVMLRGYLREQRI